MQFLLIQIAKNDGVSLEIKTPTNKNDSLWDIVGMAEGDSAKIARHHDKYLYGAK